ncbi:FAD-dependent oxidoreductase [Neptunomonas japonica]|uniref:FAD-dependent oxidoreductase n=1 Tax=Neptunomonas japonica TaxID=417574 RepID=UPI0004053725|nr:FAD-dependent oxidoreductase [Neptunomonas japonica]
MTVQTADIVIVGGGMVGVTAALVLAASGLHIVLLENREFDPELLIDDVAGQLTAGYDPRVSALTCASQQLLTHVGAWPYMQQLRTSPYTDMDVWDGEGSGHIHFSSRELHELALGHIVENRVTVAALYAAAQRIDNLRIITGVSVVQLSEPDSAADGSSRVLTCKDGSQWRSKLVVAADGAMSKVRQLASIPMWEWDYGHHAIVTTVRTEKPHQETAWQRFTDDGPLAFLPLDDPNCCSIVWSTSPDHATALIDLDDDAFCAALTRAFEGRLGGVLWADRRHLFPLRQRHAQYYVQAGLAVIGDAAHTIHPLAGQGVNLGLMDAAALAEQILSAHTRGEEIGSEAVLKRFQRQRQSANLQMSASMEAFKQLFGHQQPLLKLVRNMGMNTLNSLSPIKQHVVMQAMGLSGDIPALARRPVDRG